MLCAFCRGNSFSYSSIYKVLIDYLQEEIDAGAIIVQETVPILLDDTEETLQERVKLVEHDAYPKALEMLARGEIQLNEQGKISWNGNSS
jgi:phosphoribosylamine--glycine ligase / phosphoribosylglycinamide formyltransferase / phosphoribosylformylglycinamidine cyclo-ligase